MKIVLLTASYAPVTGGLQTVVKTLARCLQTRGHNVSVITNKYPRTLPSQETPDNISVRRWHFLTPRVAQLLNLRFDLLLAGILYGPITLLRLVFFLQRERPAVVNLHFAGGSALFVLIARYFAKFRLVVSLHGDDVEGLVQRKRFDRMIFRLLMRRAEAVTACSRYLLEQATRVEPNLVLNGRVIYNGIELPDEIQTNGKTNDVFAAGRMVASKGFDLLLKARAQSQDSWALTLVGDGPDLRSLKRLAGQLGLNGNVVFQGKKSPADVREAMTTSRVVAIPSRKESFGLVALEAMALGKPVIASKVGGLPELLEGADAFLVEPDNPSSLSEAIRRALERIRIDPGFGERNRQAALNFTAATMTDKYLDAFCANEN